MSRCHDTPLQDLWPAAPDTELSLQAHPKQWRHCSSYHDLYTLVHATSVKGCSFDENTVSGALTITQLVT